MDYKKFMADCAKRRKEIKRLREKGVDWNAIAAKYGVTRQRVQQIAAGK